MRKFKLKYLLYILLAIIVIPSIISFKYQIQDYANRNYSNNSINNTDNNSNYYNDYNNSNDNTTIENTYNTDLFIAATVKRVVDGDTIVAIIDSKEYKVRLIGVNSPEYTTKIEKYGKEATEYTTQMLTGKTVYLEKDVSETDKYGRLLRYVWLNIPTSSEESEIKEKMFNAILVLNGYAQAATYPPDVKYVNYFKEFSNKARNENIGLWKYR